MKALLQLAVDGHMRTETKAAEARWLLSCAAVGATHTKFGMHVHKAPHLHAAQGRTQPVHATGGALPGGAHLCGRVHVYQGHQLRGVQGAARAGRRLRRCRRGSYSGV